MVKQDVGCSATDDLKHLRMSAVSDQHYENMPIQIYWKFYHQKVKIFK